MTVPIVTGYYRYTDIWFEWAEKALSPEDREKVKAILAHDALVHPDHPLRLPNQDGAQLFLGIFPNGENRLLFSSKQIDYIRYWLHAMQLTEKIIPLPYSDCLLTEAFLQGVSPVTFKTGGDLKMHLKEQNKINKKISKSNNSVLANRRRNFEQARNIFLEKKAPWLAIDFEGWEMEHGMITEFGYSALHFENGQEVVEDGHWIVKERQLYTNGKYVPDNRRHFRFGTSEIVPKAELKTKIHALFTRMKSYGPLFLVFHDRAQDIKYLKYKEIDAPLDGLAFVLPASPPAEGLFVIDTADLFAALEGQRDTRSLERMCRLLQISTEYLHNAGNDAHYTLMACKEMAGGEPLDKQREARWPNQTGSELEVKRKPWEEDSDYSDEEGLMGSMDPGEYYSDELET
ncbi:hypothetical protein D9758_008845 [Tetrapyrgos nigripes]|uniref:Gfd2/YDR514C-like C-terminal domain-containing protein n=1 Tax=Tetrapyrgos nigripes TaxID=182062 RepID=A0A8H5CMD8_9AGAR|nr:hypothetical protein D9758_008845 [Tetrapyrgos nigripes]